MSTPTPLPLADSGNPAALVLMPDGEGARAFIARSHRDDVTLDAVAPSMGGGGERRRRPSELQFASPPVATRNGLAPPAQIGAPLTLAVIDPQASVFRGRPRCFCASSRP